MRNRRRALLLTVVVLLILEIVEHLIAIRYGQRAHELYDAVLYILMVPFGTWLFLTLLEGSESERMQSLRESDLQTELSQQLGSASTWDELVQQIAAYPQRVSPRAAVTLYVYNRHSKRMQPEAVCTREGQVTLQPRDAASQDTLPAVSLPQLVLQNSLVNDGDRQTPPTQPNSRYTLPLARHDQQIGVIKLDYPNGTAPSSQEIQAIKRAMPLIALALEGGLLQDLAAEQAAASDAERQEIAQNLHDTLAQNISYLRLKLDQLTGENAIREIGAVLQELERMRATADESYQQVRNTLDELGLIHSEDLVETITKQAQTISERAGFTLRSTQNGQPYTLPALTRQQVHYIAREAIHNVEKHARASQVHLQFIWLESELILKISDDGIGFDPHQIPQENHYGLWIMQQRAMDIGGTLKITPSDGQGTEVTLWVPRPAARS